MAILSKEAFMAALQARVGEGSTDDDLKFLEDMTDTYNDLETRVGEDWKAKHDALDASWRQRYRDRFYHGVEPDAQQQTPPLSRDTRPVNNTEKESQSTGETDAENIGFDDLFTPAT